MLVTTFEALIVALLAIVPGYITIWFWSRNKMWRGLTNDLQTILKCLAISAALQVAIAPYTLIVLYPIRNNPADHPWPFFIWLIALVLLLPYTAGRLLNKATEVYEKVMLAAENKNIGARLLRVVLPEGAPPSAWDAVFSEELPDGCFLILEYKDGSRIAGGYGKKSQVLQSPEPHGIYLIEEWTVDENGNIDSKVPNSCGVLVTDISDLRCVRILRGGKDDQSTEEGAKAPAKAPTSARRVEEPALRLTTPAASATSAKARASARRVEEAASPLATPAASATSAKARTSVTPAASAAAKEVEEVTASH